MGVDVGYYCKKELLVNTRNKSMYIKAENFQTESSTEVKATENNESESPYYDLTLKGSNAHVFYLTSSLKSSLLQYIHSFFVYLF